MKNNNVAIFSPSDLLKVPKELQLLNAKQLDVILMPTPPTQIKSRQGKGGEIWRYVNGAYTTKMLNLTFGFDWDFKIIKHEFDLKIGQAYVLGELTARIGDKAIIKQQFGRVDIKFLNDWVPDPNHPPESGKKIKVKSDRPLDLGNDLKAASTDALKKCATALGFFSDVYHADDFKEIIIVSDEDKAAKVKEKALSMVTHHLEKCSSLEQIAEVEEALSKAQGYAPLNEGQIEIIEFYTNKLKTKK